MLLPERAALKGGSAVPGLMLHRRSWLESSGNLLTLHQTFTLSGRVFTCPKRVAHLPIPCQWKTWLEIWCIVFFKNNIGLQFTTWKTSDPSFYHHSNRAIFEKTILCLQSVVKFVIAHLDFTTSQVIHIAPFQLVITFHCLHKAFTGTILIFINTGEDNNTIWPFITKCGWFENTKTLCSDYTMQSIG